MIFFLSHDLLHPKQMKICLVISYIEKLFFLVILVSFQIWKVEKLLG